MKRFGYILSMSFVLAGTFLGCCTNKANSASGHESTSRLSPPILTAGVTNGLVAITQWSKAVSLRNQDSHDIPIRGRLLILQGVEPAYGGPPTTNGAMTFIELQNVYAASGGGIEVYFAVTNLHCNLSDATGRVVAGRSGGGYGGRGPFSPCWVNLPYNSTVRLFVNSGSLDPLTLYPSGEPWLRWSLPSSDTNTYFFSGTLVLSTHTNLSMPPVFREKGSMATLEFPMLKITPSRIHNQKEPE